MSERSSSLGSRLTDAGRQPPQYLPVWIATGRDSLHRLLSEWLSLLFGLPLVLRERHPFADDFSASLVFRLHVQILRFESWSTVQMFEIDCTSCIWPRFPKAWIYQIAHMQNLFCTNCVIPLIDLGLLVQNHVQQGSVDFELSVVFDKTQLAEFVHEKTDP